MSKYVIDSSTLTSIANAIRGKDGTTAPIVVSDFANRIAAIPSGGSSGNVVFTGWIGSLQVSQIVNSSGKLQSMVYIPPVYEIGDTITLDYKITSGGTQRKYDMIIYKVTSTGGQANKATVLNSFSAASGTINDSYSFTVEEGENYGYAIILRITNKTATTSSVSHNIDITKCEVS